MDWDKWNAYYAKCTLIVQNDPDKIDDVRRFLSEWLDTGGDIPPTDLFDEGSDEAPMTVTTTITGTQTLSKGSTEPPGMSDLLQKMKQVGTGNDSSPPRTCNPSMHSPS